jgi:hypothetical protein
VVEHGERKDGTKGSAFKRHRGGVSPDHVDVRFVKPLEQLLCENRIVLEGR